MKMKLVLFVALFAIASVSSGQQKSACDNWNWLMGNWAGEGGGQPGQGGGKFSFSINLDSNIIVRKSHSEYPATENKPAVKHDDLMVVYKDTAGNLSKAIYFDNEGHVINYTITYAAKSIVLASEKIPGDPAFRLTYSLLDNEIVETKFEISPDGEKYVMYIQGKSKKVK